MTHLATSIKAIKAFVHQIDPKAVFNQGWDAKLPEYANVKVNDGSRLIVAQCTDTVYVVSYIFGDILVASYLTTDFESNDLADKFLTKISSNSKEHSTDFLNTGSAKLTKAGSLQQDRGSASRDPNAPPGFEDEFQLGVQHQPHRGPGLYFNPDADRLPPGGRFPSLDPMTGPSRLGNGGGMFPVPHSGLSGSSPFRYDPTTPFDPVSRDPSESLGDRLEYRGTGSGTGSGTGGAGFGVPPI